MPDAGAEIKKLLAEKRIVIGAERAMKLLRQGKLAKVYLSASCPQNVRDDFKRYCSVDGVDCEELPISNEELGVWCKRPFAISAVGVLKSAA